MEAVYMPDLTNPYRTPNSSFEVPHTSEVLDKTQKRDRTVETTTMLLWLATTVVAIAGFVILSTARIFQGHLQLEMSDIFSRGVGWFLTVAWVIATGAIVALRRSGWPRTIGIVLLTAYLLGMALIALQFLIDVWSPTWTLVP
jgi:hypothetical protein